MPVFSETNLSRAVTHALRHAPGEYGLAVDNDGWVEMRSLVNALSAAGFDGLTEDAVLRMIANSSKVRHEVVGDRIRATQGWREFTLYRAVPQTGELTVTFALTALGEASIDDLSVSLLDPEPIRAR